jgi:outer membrane receptor protein involved in Fe transport
MVVVAAIVVCGQFVSAQEEERTEEAALAQVPTATFEAEVTVTGSLIPRPSLESLSPVAVLDAPEELRLSGTVRIEDLVTTLPQVFAGQNSTISNGATGTASVDLRSLGPQRTLVLINGRRMAFGDFFGADLNAIPSSLVQRIDVLTGGASTVYGSDALAGVVNFILDKSFEGVRGGVQYSFYNHDNNNELAQRINQEAGFDYPSGMVNDGHAINASVGLGSKFAGGKGHAVAYVDYRNVDALTKAARDYVNCFVAAGPEGPLCGGSSTGAEGRFVAWNADGSFNGDYLLHTVADGGDGWSLRPRTGERFNYGPFNYIQRPDEKLNAGGFVNYEINDHFDAYLELMFMQDYSDAQIAPSGTFFIIDRVNCDNPMLSAQQHDVLCVQGGYSDDQYAEVSIGRRNVEGEPRADQLGHTNTRLVAGVRGDIDDAWSYDLYGLRAEGTLRDSYVNDLSVQRMFNALDVIEDPSTGEWVCRNPQARGNGCVPWNIFREGAVTQEAVDYISITTVLTQRTKTELASLAATGDLEDYGVVIPSASEAVRLAVGAEFRTESLQYLPDEAQASGDIAGFGASSQPGVEASYRVKEIYLETLVPIVQDVRGARDLSLELGYRHSDYSSFGDVGTSKALFNWAISGSWRIRGGYNRAVRAPSVAELFSSPLSWGSSYVDLCEGEQPQASFEQCARTGVTEEQYGNIPAAPPELSGGSNTIIGGNELLEPEKGDTVTFGLVWTPQRLSGLSVTLDYFEIRIDDAIEQLPVESIHRVCMETGDPYVCGRIHRDARGSIWLSAEGYTDQTDDNVGLRTTEGIDVNVNYLIGLGNAGFLSTDLMGTYLLAQKLENPLFDFECVGYFGLQCGPSQSKWRHRLRATWEASSAFNLSLAWRYLGRAENDDASPRPDLGDPGYMEFWRINGSHEIGPYNWFDLAASYTFRSVRFTLGINNILDEEPPLLPGLNDDFNINLYGNYDPLGRYIFASLQFEF